jgi:hypothetical protein
MGFCESRQGKINFKERNITERDSTNMIHSKFKLSDKVVRINFPQIEHQLFNS